MRGADMVVRGRYADRIDPFDCAQGARWRKGKRLGKDDRLITMKRPADKDASRVMSPRLWGQLPQNITVRRIRARSARPGFRTQELLLITTLLDPVPFRQAQGPEPAEGLWPVETLVALYEPFGCAQGTRAAGGWNSISTTSRPPCRHRACAA